MSKVVALKCRECGAEYDPSLQNTCYECFGPLEVVYDWDIISSRISKESIENGPNSMWRYVDLLPVDGGKIIDLGAGFNRLHKLENLGKELGIKNLYALDDSVNPTNSFKDRVTSVAVSKAIEFNVRAVGCASTGNLAASVSAHAAKAELPAYIFVPEGIEKGKIVQSLVYGANIIEVEGTYDDANRLATEIADTHPDWAFVNINVRPYYTEGSKTLAFEVAEQLGWQTPDHVVVPMASGALLCAIHRGFRELERVGLIDNSELKISGMQPAGCNPIVRAVKENREVIPIRKPQTIAHSLAIGNPADGYYAKKVINGTGGYAEDPTDEEIISAIKLLAETEGIFTEPAGGVTLGGFIRLVNRGMVDTDEVVVLYLTGNGLKTQDAVVDSLPDPVKIKPTLMEFEKIYSSRKLTEEVTT